MNTCMCMYYTFGEFYIFIYFGPSKKGQMFLVQISIKRELAGAFFSYLLLPIDCFLYI